MFCYTDIDFLPPACNAMEVLAAEGFEVDVVTYHRGKTWSRQFGPSIKVYRLNRPGDTFPTHSISKARQPVSFVSSALRLAHKRRWHVAYGHDMHGFAAASVVGAAFNIPVVYHCHDLRWPMDQLGRVDRWVKRWELWRASRADLVIVPDARRGAILAEQAGLLEEPLTVWNCPRLGHEGRTQHNERRLWPLPVPAVIRPGTMGPGHALEQAIKSIPGWPESSQLVLVGAQDAGEERSNRAVDHGGYATRGYVRKLKAAAEAEGVEHRVSFLPPVPSHRIHQVISGADVGLAVYSTEGDINRRYMGTASVKFFDFLRAGIPAVVGEDPGFRDLVELFDCGVAISEASSAAIGEAVNLLLEDEITLQRLERNAYEGHVRLANYETQFRPVVEAIEKIVGRRGIKRGVV